MRRSSSSSSSFFFFFFFQATYVDGEACRGQSLYKEARRMWNWHDKRARLLFHWMTKHVMLSGLNALAGETHGKTFRPLSGSWFLLEQRGSNHRGCVSLSITLTPFHLHLFLLRGGGCKVRSRFIDCKYLSRCFFYPPIIQSFVTSMMMWKKAFEPRLCRNCFKIQRAGLPVIRHPEWYSNSVTLVPAKRKTQTGKRCLH